MADKDVLAAAAHADPEKPPLEVAEGVVVTLTKEDVRLSSGSSYKELAEIDRLWCAVFPITPHAEVKIVDPWRWL